ncbi:hypothetical protein LSUE1_G003557 [Lachnellula suecica]|uniref:Uncharacterized protein n=1 Tax=Lachnellula suecica TaxID=602035 RepID=A0A8T9CGX5_9HELO|nr:hypothetical protein LSUE1_G003557 [Lachnellula suecica]
MEFPHLHNIAEISTETLTQPEVTPEKLTIMKLRDSFLLNDYASEVGTPTGRRKSFDFSSGLDGHQSLARSSSRQVSTSSRRSLANGTSRNSLSNKMSLELSRQAEGKFYALMDIVSSASREASSLKEVWSGMNREREALTREREELWEQVSEVTETLERKENEHQHHRHTFGERKQQIEKLLLELSTALTTISEHKKKGDERDHEISETERDNYLVEKERLQELLRKTNIKNDVISLELLEMTENQLRDNNRHKETIRELESERDNFSHTVDHLRREIKTKSAASDEVEIRHSELTLKLEQLKRENLNTKEKLGILEFERTEQHELLERTREESRSLTVEKNQLKDDAEMWRHRTSDQQRLVNTLQESFKKTESAVEEAPSEVHILTDRLSLAERERGDSRNHNNTLHREITELKEKLVIVQAELRVTAETRNRLREELHEHKLRYEEVTETMTEFKDSSGGYEFEIENLRTMLRESRGQKERAIAARNSADRERDEYIARYEEKCREMERFEQSASSHFHSYASSGGHNLSSRVVSRTNTTGTTMHNGNGTEGRSGEFGTSESVSDARHD